MSSRELTLTDPTSAPTFGEGPLSRWCRTALYDTRDEVFVRLTLRMVVLMSLALATLFVIVHGSLVPTWLALGCYAAMWGWFAPPVILMLHNTMHRPFLRSRFLGRVHPYAMSFLFGIPTGYQEHHLGMHHVEDNMPSDLSSTMRFKRDSFLHFLVYFARFFFLALPELTRYLVRNRRKTMARRALVSDLCHQSIVLTALWIDWRFGLIAFLLPMVTCRFMMMAGNWGQHAFLNTARDNDGVSNAISCINVGYNQRCFNDGYHVGHHLRANRHWTELPADFMASREMYARDGALVFEGIDFFMVSVLLWTRQYRLLARRFVRLGRDMTDDEVVALLRSRVHPVPAWPEHARAAEAA
jgi:hypothetical protein